MNTPWFKNSKPPKKNYPDPAESPPGRAILKLFTQCAINHYGECADALDLLGYEPGYASGILDRLVRYGYLKRINRGTYRLPTTGEKAEFIESRKKSLGIDVNDAGSETAPVIG